LFGALVITAISTVPKDSTINIYTDNQNVINIAMSQYQNKVIGKKFKQLNFILWEIFFELKKTLNLNINFHKVKAHTSDKWNNIADTLANEGRSEGNVLLDDKICNSNVTATFFNINIDTNIRHFVKEIFNIKNELLFQNLKGRARNQVIFRVGRGSDFFITSIYIM
jgi:hypothetical protein